MSETSFFWQGGRKIEVKQDDVEMTIHAENEAAARNAASRAGVELRETKTAAPGLINVRPAGDRDASMARLRTDRNVVHHVYRNNREPDSEYLITESFFIKFKEHTPEQLMRDYFAAEHLVVEREMGNNTYLVRVTNETGRNPIRTANAALERPEVEYAEPNLVRRLTRFFIPPDTLFSRQWHLHAPASQVQLVPGAGIFAAEAWDTSRGVRDVVVAVADDGFDLTHPDFQGPGKVIAALNANVTMASGAAHIAWDNNVSPRPGDYHGTPCLGVAVAEGNGSGVVGAAPGCALVAVRFPLDMTDAHFILMFQKISTLADVVSCSWGFGPADAPMSTALRSAIATLAVSGGRRGKGLVFCVAAGNNNCPVQDLTNTRTYRFRTRAGIRSYSGPIDRWIAAHPDVITVSASTSLKTRSAYSSWGRQISVCAPSDNWDDLGEMTPPPPGLGVMTTDNEGFGAGSDFTPSSRFTGAFGGTSSATPTVAGVCALVISTDRSLPGLEVKALIQQTADKDLSLVTHTPVNEPGTFSSEGFSLWFGHGKVNALRAVTAAALRVAAERMVEVEARPNQQIPDVGTPIVSTIEVGEDGSITDLRIRVDIAHTYIGDLRVDLVAPDGTSVVLHNNTGGSADNLFRTYSVQDTPALRPLIGRSVRGTWRLRVRDTVRFDVGRLNQWRIAARVAVAVVGPTAPLVADGTDVSRLAGL